MTEGDEPAIRFTDNRKIDRTPAGGGAPPPVAPADPEEDDVPKAEALLLEERTRDLQRVQAEYANYRKRADRDRLAAGEIAIGRTLVELLPVIDDLDRAKAHGDYSGALKAVGDRLDVVFGKLGLIAFGEVGDPFDPNLHEAVQHGESAEVSVPTCTTIMRVGYRYGERLLRPAMVGVSDPAAAAEPEPDAEPAADEAGTEQTATVEAGTDETE